MNGNSGFTLTELIVTMAIAAILLTVGVPSFRDMILNNRIVTQTNELLAALNLTRSEAIKRGVRVVMCRSAGSGCATVSTSVWEAGWIIFADSNGNGALDADEPIIRVREGVGGAITIRSGGNFSRWVAYQPDGVSRGNTNLANDTFRICDSRGVDHARFVAVNIVGRPRVRPKRTTDACP
jgi:type IV fimbrial biogenesis protein FimT